ncbi:MAG: hypothetical protein V4609_14710 [Pseudomonadota bacterium]
MSLFKRIFRDKAGAEPSQPASSSGFEDSDNDSVQGEPSRGPGRREAVHMVLRETMRQHGIPADWIEGRTLKLVDPVRATTGTYVTLVIKGGQDRLLTYVPAFQASFREAMARFDPRVTDWLRGVSWEFADGSTAPAAAQTKAKAPPAEAPANSGFDPTPSLIPTPQSPAEADQLEQDLQALFAIRDAALRPSDAPPQDFQATRPAP